MTPELKRAYIQLHIAIFLFGFTAILGKLINLAEAPLVWHRLWITCISLLLVPGVIKAIFALPRKNLLTFAGIGIVTVTHWLAFYASIKYGSASVALSCLATTSLFTALIEPMLFKKKISPAEVIVGLVVVMGIYIITQAAIDQVVGIVLGLFSALLASLFTTLNKKYMYEHHPIAITVVQLGVGFLFITAMLPIYFNNFPGAVFMPSTMDWVYLLVLSLLCTSVGYVLGLLALKHVSAFTANLTVNLEPVYGIIMAAFILNEHEELNSRFYIGTAIILISVLLHPLINKMRKPVQIID